MPVAAGPDRFRGCGPAGRSTATGMQSPRPQGTSPRPPPRATPPPGAGGGSTASRRFPATAASVGQARRFLLEPPARGRVPTMRMRWCSCSRSWPPTPCRHAATEFEVSVHVVGETGRRRRGHRRRLRLPDPQEPAADAPHGRGLHIVQTLADAWGIEMQRDRPGKTVWFSLALPAEDGPAVEPADISPVAATSEPAIGGEHRDTPARPAGDRAGRPGRLRRRAGLAPAWRAGGARRPTRRGHRDR